MLSSVKRLPNTPLIPKVPENGKMEALGMSLIAFYFAIKVISKYRLPSDWEEYKARLIFEDLKKLIKALENEKNNLQGLFDQALANISFSFTVEGNLSVYKQYDCKRGELEQAIKDNGFETLADEFDDFENESPYFQEIENLKFKLSLIEKIQKIVKYQEGGLDWKKAKQFAKDFLRLRG